MTDSTIKIYNARYSKLMKLLDFIAVNLFIFAYLKYFFVEPSTASLFLGIIYSSFTGSTEIGRQLMEQCAKDIKKVSLELGGNAPFIVFDDADLDKAVEGALASKFRNAGQTCVCANRLYVQDGVYDRFAEKLQQAVSKLQIGDGLQPNVTIGPLIDEKAIAKVQEHIADALGKGARRAHRPGRRDR